MPGAITGLTFGIESLLFQNESMDIIIFTQQMIFMLGNAKSLFM